MKKFILPGFIVICAFGLFFMNMGKNDINPNVLIDDNIIKSQNECIDDLESSLYDFSTENALLQDEISFLKDENEELQAQVLQFELKLTKMRKNVTRMELELHTAVTKLAKLIQEKEQSTQAPFVLANNEKIVLPQPLHELDKFQSLSLIHISEPTRPY